MRRVVTGNGEGYCRNRSDGLVPAQKPILTWISATQLRLTSRLNRTKKARAAIAASSRDQLRLGAPAVVTLVGQLGDVAFFGGRQLSKEITIMPDVAVVNGIILGDPANEERDPVEYYVNGTAHLANWLSNHGLEGSGVFREAVDLLDYFSRDVADREPGRAVTAATALAELGTVGAAAYLLRDRQNNQMRTELERYATDADGGAGYFYLFYIAGRLAGRGWKVDFVRESHDPGARRPDLRAERGGAHIFIEANAKQPTIPVETTDRLWYTIRDLIEDKKQKFADPAFQPGMIVADISPTKFDANETGTPPQLELSREHAEPLPESGLIYRLYEDTAWKGRLHNQGNVIAYLVEQFASIDRARFGVTQCLLTVTRRALVTPVGVAFPKLHVLIVERAARANAMLDLCRFVYLV